MNHKSTEYAVSHATDAQLLTEIIKGAFERNILMYRINRLDIPSEMKMSLFASADSGAQRETVLDMVNNMDPTTGRAASVMTSLLERINWNSIGETAADSIKLRTEVGATSGAEKRPNHKKESWVYFIESKDSGLIKIGYSINPKQRFGSIKTMSPEHLELIGMMPGGKTEESELHKRFGESRAHGEWFTSSPELLDFIEPHRTTE